MDQRWEIGNEVIDSVLPGQVVADEVEIELTILGRKEDILTIVTSLCDVIRLAWKDEAATAWHIGISTEEVRSRGGIALPRMGAIACSGAGTVGT